VLKLRCGDEVRRLPLDARPSYGDVRTAIRKVWPELENGQARYRDDEGDMCTLCPASFEDFLFLAGSLQDAPLMLRLEFVEPMAKNEYDRSYARTTTSWTCNPSPEDADNNVTCNMQDFNLHNFRHVKRRHLHGAQARETNRSTWREVAQAFRALSHTQHPVLGQDTWGLACPGGCGFAVTWHGTHCCNACKNNDGKKHGPMCHGHVLSGSQEVEGSTEVVDDTTVPSSVECPVAPPQLLISATALHQADTDESIVNVACETGKLEQREDSVEEMQEASAPAPELAVLGEVTCNSEVAPEAAAQDTDSKVCPGGCGFAVTWHPTHCCGACKRRGGGKHGPKCQHHLARTDRSKAESALDEPEIIADVLSHFSVQEVDEPHASGGLEEPDAQQTCTSEVSSQRDLVPQATAQDTEKKVCPSGCGFAVTWHPTHCCSACKNRRRHGPKCQRQLIDVDLSAAVAELDEPEDIADVVSHCEEGWEKVVVHDVRDEETPGPAYENVVEAAGPALTCGGEDGFDGVPQADDQNTRETECPEGCGFVVTWHPTHCCAACKNKIGKHGPKCQQQLIKTSRIETEPAVHEPQEMMHVASQCAPVVEEQEQKSPVSVGADDGPKARVCPGGCGFEVTWHPTHCCQGCVVSGMHGPRCQRQRASATGEEDMPEARGAPSQFGLYVGASA